MQGRGFVSRGTPTLTITFEGQAWWLQVTRPDGEGYLDFVPLHERDVRADDVRRFLGDPRGLRWRELRAPPGLPRACEAESGLYMIHLHGARGLEVTPEQMQAELLAWLEAPAGPPTRGRRLA